MGVQANEAHVKGTKGKFFIAVESTPGTFVKATTGASFNAESFSMTPKVNRKSRIDAYMASRDVLERITGKSEYVWAANGWWIPSGVKNTAPDCAPFLIGAGFTETVNANDVSYALNSNQAMTLLSGTRHYQSILQESMAGMWTDEYKFMFSGGDEPKWSASGGGMTYALTVPTTLNGAMAGDTSLDVDDIYSMETSASATGSAGTGAHSVVQIDSDNNSNAGHDVVADDGAGGYTTADNATGADAAAVIPYVPTHTDAGSPISGVSGTLAYDDSVEASVNMVFTQLEITVKNTVKPFNDEAFTQNVRDAIPLMREITGQVTFRVRQDFLRYISNRRSYGVTSITATVGGAAQTGTRLVVTLPYCEIDWSAIDVPAQEEATIALPFTALGSSGNDAMTVMHT